MNSNHKNTSILLSEDVKPWLYRKLHVENRSLSNYLNTMLKRQMQMEGTIQIEMPSIHGMEIIEIKCND